MTGRAKPAYWIGDVHVHDGQCWWSALIETAPTDDGRRRWKECTRTLGREEDIVPALKGVAELPEDTPPWVRNIVTEVRGGKGGRVGRQNQSSAGLQPMKKGIGRQRQGEVVRRTVKGR